MSVALSVYPNTRFEAEQRRWADKLLQRVRVMAGPMARWHEAQIASGVSIYDANQKLLGYVNRLSRADFNLTAFDSELCELAEAMPGKYRRLCDEAESEGHWGATFGGLVDESPTERAARIIEARYQLGVDFPSMLKRFGEDGAGVRLADPLWWRRKLRTEAHRETEQVLRELGAVCRKRAAYVSNLTLRRFLDQQQRNRSLLENLEAENEDGQCFTLAELSDLGVSNPENRFAELMIRNRGFEEWVEARNTNHGERWVCMFYTWTTPSRYHAVHSGKGGRLNHKYAGASPAEAAQFLNKLWAKARAKAKRDEVEMFGFRVAEPHHDGTPHWHMMLFVQEHQKKRLTNILKHYIFSVDGNERGAAKHRFGVTEIDPGKGSASGYIVKYISKNIKGMNVGIDEEADDYAVVTAIRVQAWASIWGIRQFQQIGGPPVTPYRELRRVARNREELPEEAQQCEQLELLIDAADKADWCAYTNHMGGAVAPLVARPLRAAQFIRDALGKYGDAVPVLVGLWSHFVAPVIRSRFHVWEVKMKSVASVVQEAVAPRAPPALALDLCQ